MPEPSGGTRASGVSAHLVAAVVISCAALGFSLAAFSVSLVALLR